MKRMQEKRRPAAALAQAIRMMMVNLSIWIDEENCPQFRAIYEDYYSHLAHRLDAAGG